jgi:hypothetical protein
MFRNRPVFTNWMAIRTSYLLLFVWGSLTLCTGCMGPGLSTTVLSDTVIVGDQTWSGLVKISGVVTVKKHAHLTIAPGTRIEFARIDRDGDAIGDAEILVEGSLTAVGTKEAPIVFTSGEREPKRADWKYLYLDFAQKGEIEYIVSEYAYSGIQVHFCRASVKNSVFRHNVDGVRFSTVNIEVSGNRIYGNTNGLRYEERGGTAHIHHNDIRSNETGLFVVTRSDDKALIEQNNIVENRQGNVKLGLTQSGDVTLPRNWWGTVDEQEIAATFFDHKFDESLGTVRAPEPLNTPVTVFVK